MSKLSIIIPVYYNEGSLIQVYESLQEDVLGKLDNYEIIFIDDGSKDDSWKIISQIAQTNQRIKCFKLSRNFGSHAAIFAGLNNCTGDCAVVKAADMQEPSSIILEMYNSWKEGNNVVLATREDREDSFLSKFNANIYYTLVRKMALKNMPKQGFDIYLIDRKVIEVLKLLDERNSALTLQILWAGFKTSYIPYNRQKREIGRSRWTLRKKIKLTVDSVLSFSFVPIRFISLIGLLAFLFSIVWAIYVLIGKFMGNIPIAGYTSLVIIILFFCGGIMLTLGILGEYIWRILDASRNRPVYIIEEVNNEAN